MGKGSSKSKGSRFERKTCNRLSLWVSDMTREDVFWRSSMSGGRATVARKSTRKRARMTAVAGDICAIHSSGHALLHHFMIECKHYADAQLEKVFWGLQGNYHKFWWKPLEEASAIDRHPMVIVKQNLKPEIILTTEVGAGLLQDCVRVGEEEDFPLVAALPELGCFVFRFEDMLGAVSYAKMRRQLRRDVEIA